MPGAIYGYTNSDLASLEHGQSSLRLAPYLAHAQGDIKNALDIYVWNAQVSARFLGPLQMVEVALRNACAYELRAFFGPNWFQDRSFFAIDSKFGGDFRAAKNALISEGKAVNEGAFIARSVLGFWTRLFAIEYERSLWAPTLSRVFTPAAPVRRADVESELLAYRELRNRIAHFEPIWQRDVAEDLRLVVRIAEWIDSALARFVSDYESVTNSLKCRPDVSGTMKSSGLPSRVESF